MRKAIEEVKRVVPPHVLNPTLLVIFHIALSSITTTLIAPYVPSPTAGLLRPNFTPWLLPYIGLQIAEPLAAWFGGFDAYETTLFSVLTHAPVTHFIANYHPSVALTSHAIILAKSAFDLTLPIYLIRPQQKQHHHHHHSDDRKVGTEPQTLFATSLLSSTLLVVFTALFQHFFLTIFAVTHFPQVESVVRAHRYSPAVLFSGLAPAGEAIQRLIFYPAIKSGKPWKVVRERLGLIAGLSAMRTLVGLGGEGGLNGAAGVAGGWIAIEAVVGVVLGWVASA